MASSFVDKKSIIQVLGCLIKHPYLMEQGDKYFFNTDDFVEPFHKAIFGAVFNLRAQGAKKIELLDIDNYLSSRPVLYKLYNDNKGPEWIIDATRTADIQKFDYYYNRMKKFTLLRMYDNYGIDVRWLYNPDNITDIATLQKQEDWLDTNPIESIAIAIDEKVDEIKAKYLNTTEGASLHAGSGLLELIAKLEETPEVGIPLYGPLINTITRGARLKKFYLRSAPTGLGKAQPNNLVIPTPEGPKKIGDIKPGDFLFDRKGKPTKVLQIHPQKTKRHVYEITFADGRKTEACGDHLWEYFTDRRYPHKVKTTREMMELANENGGYKGSNGYLFKIPINQAVEFPEREYDLHPYTMGALLGDGSFRQSCLMFSSADEEIVKKIAELEGWDYFKENNDTFSWFFREKGETRNRVQSKNILSHTKLNHLKSEKKFIPEEYLLGSVSQRMSLLQGLLDTDGSIDKKGRVSYFTVSEQMKEDVLNLVRSLGFIGTVSEDRRKDKYPTTGVCYIISIQSDAKYKKEMFSLKRKVDIAIEYENTSKRKEYNDYIAITNIRKTDRLEEMTCFTVDNEEHLFLTNDYIVTHNTRMMVADICNFGCDQIYDTFLQKWVKNGTKEESLFITTELEHEEIQTMFLAFLSGVREDAILNGQYAEGEKERVIEAAKIIKDSPIWIEHLPDFSLRDIENTIRRHVRENGVKYVAFDYIHTSLKILEEITKRAGGIRLREDNILFMLAIRLKDLCNELGIFMISSTQLNGDWEDKSDGNQNLLRGSKAIADKIDLGMITLPVTKNDKECLQTILSSGAFPEPNMVHHIYKNRRGKYKSVKLWCSADLGTCRVTPLFLTDNNYNLIPIEDIEIIVEKEESAF